MTLQRPNANWQWQIVNVDGSTRLQMELGSDNSLILFDPANVGNRLVFSPGGMTPGISLNGTSFLTMPMADGRYLQLNGGNVVLGGGGMQSISVPAPTAGRGNDLVIKAGDAGTDTDNDGGSLVLSSGNSTGGGLSSIVFKTANRNAPGNESNEPLTRMTISEWGAVNIGSAAGTGVFWEDVGGLDVSWGGIPASLMLGADVNQTTRTDGAEKSATISMPNFHSDTSMPTILVEGYAKQDSTFVALGGFGPYSASATDIGLITSTDPASPGGTIRLYVNRTGQVGIGTTTPAAQLHVADSMQVDGAARFNGPTHIEPQGDISMGLFTN